MAKQTITFVLDTNRDRDVLRWLEGQANKSSAIREAIRAQMDRADVTLRDVLAAIQDLKRHNGTPPATGKRNIKKKLGKNQKDNNWGKSCNVRTPPKDSEPAAARGRSRVKDQSAQKNTFDFQNHIPQCVRCIDV